MLCRFAQFIAAMNCGCGELASNSFSYLRSQSLRHLYVVPAHGAKRKRSLSKSVLEMESGFPIPILSEIWLDENRQAEAARGNFQAPRVVCVSTGSSCHIGAVTKALGRSSPNKSILSASGSRA